MKSWSKEECLSAIKDFYLKNNRIPKAKDFRLGDKNYPSTKTVQRNCGSWNTAIIEAGLEPNLHFKWTSANILKAIIEFSIKEGRSPEAKDFTDKTKYPSFSTVARHFGSWNNAIIAAGLNINISSFGTPTLAKDNVLYRSIAEAYFVDNYLYNKYDYVYEKPYGNGWLYDFYLPLYNVYIEIVGGLRPERILEKIEYNKVHKVNCLFISKDIIKGDYDLQYEINSTL